MTPTLTHAAHVSAHHVPLYLALWGLGMIVGNIVGGWAADRALIPAIFGILVWNAVFLSVFYFTATDPLSAAVTLFLIGIGFALVPALQARLMDVAQDAQALAAAMNHSAFNLSNAIGAWTGGMAISAGWGWHSTGLVAGGLAIGGLAMMGLSCALARMGNTFSNKTMGF
ncbi:MFS transporter [Gluconobacter wancherniae]|uniref:MFS transporter n=1 Tax=Gluconobacter wancherniae TaxID=1307955 RepID=UPI001B8BAB85|nr:MFS transporter [Gluconobacter wancherniae]